MLVWIAIVALLIVLVWVTQLREGFISEDRISTVNVNEQLYHDRATPSEVTPSEEMPSEQTILNGKLGEGLPDPSVLANQLRGLMKRVNPSSDGTIDVMGNDMSPIMNKMQGLLGKYDNPESMGHVLSIKDKDPGELARMYLNINN
jgi:hypothetical protein